MFEDLHGKAIVCVAIGCALLAGTQSLARAIPAEETRVAALAPPAPGDAADMTLDFLPDEASPDAVKVVLTPQTRSLTLLEARRAAEEGFLAALDEPALKGTLRRVTVVVRLVPESDDPRLTRTYRYFARGAGVWSLTAAF